MSRLPDAVPAGHAVREPAAPHTWFPSLVETVRRDVERATFDPRFLRQARPWSGWVLGPGKQPDEYEALATRNACARLVNHRASLRPIDCAAAPVRGTGLSWLRDCPTGAVLAFTHTGVMMASGMATQRELSGRLCFVPGEPPAIRSAIGATAAGGLSAANLAYRFVGRQRRLEVMRQLLSEGEICGVPADVPGVAESVLLGRTVRTTRAPAALAWAAGVPLVLVASFWDDREFEVRSHALHPAQFESTAALHDAQMAMYDSWAREHPEQLIVFPAAEFSRLRARRMSAAEDVTRASRAREEAEDAVHATKQRRRDLLAADASEGEVAGVERDRLAARQALRRAKSDLNDAKVALHDVIRRTRQPSAEPQPRSRDTLRN